MIEKILERLLQRAEYLKVAMTENSKNGYKNSAEKAMNELVAIKYAIEIVQEVAKEYGNGWIPCSERLPNKEEYQKCNGQFIVSDGNRTYATYFDIYDTLKFGEPTIERFRVDRVVIAWQPLPVPYQKGE